MKNLNSQTGLMLGCALFLGASCLFAQDWPQWRGPNRDGKVAGFDAPETWPQQLTQQWKVVVGTGDATPALVGDKLYAFGRKEADEVIACLDAATGKTLWEEKYPADYVVTGPPARHPGPRSSPVVADGRICALGVGGILSCLDAATGKVVWRKQSTNDFMDTPNRFDTSMSPIVVDGRCIVHVGGKGSGAVIAFDLKSGEPKWKWDGDAPANSSPVVMTVGGTKMVVTITAKLLVGLDAADGKLLWQTPFAATQGNNTTPVVDGQTVIISGQGKGMFALKVEKQDGAFAVTNLWQNTQLGSRFTTPVLKNGMLYGFFKAGLFCADAATGETHWTADIAEKDSASILDAGSVMLALAVKSGLIAFKPGDKEYKELARIKVADKETWAHPVVAGKRIFVRDQDSMALWTLE
jgi:outer membrane protein assembly factor BamB